MSDSQHHPLRRGIIATWGLAAALMCGAAGIRAQSPSGGDTLSAASIADSLAVLDRLKDRLAANVNDADTWHHLGIIAWSLAVRAKGPDAPSSIDAAKLGRLADTSLRLASQLAPTNPGYRIDVGRLLASGAAITRTASRGHFEAALILGRKSNEPRLHAEAALLYGRTFWWRYDLFSNRRLPAIEGFAPNSVTDAMQPLARTADVAEQIANLQAAGELLGRERCPPCIPLTVDQVLRMMSQGGAGLARAEGALRETYSEAGARYQSLPQTSMKAARDLIETSTSALPPEVTGALDFERAFKFFQEAYDADRAFPGTFRAMAMIYADRGLWRQLESFALSHVAAVPRDSLAWMALGLALHRQEKEKAAKAAFDSALAMMSERERNRLDNWRRVMPPRVARSLMEPLDERRGAADMYWMLASPFWADEGNDTKIEFLSRVTFAELRWTVEEFRLSGADTDRGDVHVRYGPPEEIALIGPRGSDNAADVVMFWMYSNGLMFAFRGMPTFGTAHTAFGDGAMVDAIKQAQPVRWDNVTAPTPDSLPTQVARFRANRDSVDVVIAAQFMSPDSIRGTMSIAAEVKRHFWLVAPGSNERLSRSAPLDTGGVYSMSHRIAPGDFLYRVEEFGETSKRGGRATGGVAANTTAFPLRGFAISDVLLGTNAAPLDRAHTRWSSVRMAPLAGSIARGADLAVIWENYDFAQKDGNASYEVSVTLKRVRSAAGRIVARINSAVDVRTQSENDRVVIAFDRVVPFDEAFADQVILSLGETPTGTYALTLEVTDRLTGKTAARSTVLRIN